MTRYWNRSIYQLYPILYILERLNLGLTIFFTLIPINKEKQDLQPQNFVCFILLENFSLFASIAKGKNHTYE